MRVCLGLRAKTKKITVIKKKTPAPIEKVLEDIQTKLNALTHKDT